MTRKDYLVKYHKVLFELRYMEKSLRRIAKEQKVGLSTVMRLKKKFALSNNAKNNWPCRALWGIFLKKVDAKVHFSHQNRSSFVRFISEGFPTLGTR